jgi:hypothetical protein
VKTGGLRALTCMQPASRNREVLAVPGAIRSKLAPELNERTVDDPHRPLVTFLCQQALVVKRLLQSCPTG